ncbi:MAG TPA: hypothetical protein IAC14_04370 [Candidatus Scybalomonas excrementigallinarum]|nr:hypothetical protein [Candidatus Scybalomonas excrementigallinarum]
MAYTVLKPINIGGKRRIIGEVLNDNDVAAGRVYSLVKSGYISEIKTIPEVVNENIKEGIDVAELKQLTINIPIKQNDGVFDIEVALDDAVEVFTILQSKVEEATERIKKIEKEEVLILIDATDSRKSVKATAAEQAKKINQKIEDNGENNSSMESDGQEDLSAAETTNDTDSDDEKQEGEE